MIYTSEKELEVLFPKNGFKKKPRKFHAGLKELSSNCQSFWNFRRIVLPSLPFTRIKYMPLLSD